MCMHLIQSALVVFTRISRVQASIIRVLVDDNSNSLDYRPAAVQVSEEVVQAREVGA